jgi:NAD(P)-dependent dehydrogenase (short-subunit alcohol dehydrogenase family)
MPRRELKSTMNVFRLDGRRALITGASKGIGLGIARAMAEAGADLVLAARNLAELNAAAEELRQTGRQVSVAPLDLRETERIAAWYDQVVQDHGRPDILVNAAGITRRAPAEDLTQADWDDTLAVNLTAAFALSQAFARHLIAAGARGKIINVASLMTAAARKTTAAYTASKGGIGQLTKALAVDWADKGILVNAVAPGYVTTKLTEPLWKDAEFDAWVKGRCPLGRWGVPEDIAWPAVFLASPAADYVTGQVLFVDGGWMATF